MLKPNFKRSKHHAIVVLFCLFLKTTFVAAIDVTIERSPSITENEFKGASLIKLSGQATRYEGGLTTGGNGLVYKNVPAGEYAAVVWNPIITWSESPLWSVSLSIDGSKDIILKAKRPEKKITLSVSSDLKLADLFPRLDFVPCRIQTINATFACRFSYQWLGLQTHEKNTLSAEVNLDPGDYVLIIPYPFPSEGWPPLAQFDCPYLAVPFTFNDAENVNANGSHDVKVSIITKIKKSDVPRANQ